MKESNRSYKDRHNLRKYPGGTIKNPKKGAVMYPKIMKSNNLIIAGLSDDGRKTGRLWEIFDHLTKTVEKTGIFLIVIQSVIVVACAICLWMKLPSDEYKKSLL